MRLFRCGIFLLFILLSGCSFMNAAYVQEQSHSPAIPSPTPEHTSTVEPTIQPSKEAMFYQSSVNILLGDGKERSLVLGMTFEEVNEVLAQAGTSLLDINNNYYSITSQENYILLFTSSLDGKYLKEISVATDQIATDQGLRVGDDVSKIERLYGVPHNEEEQLSSNGDDPNFLGEWWYEYYFTGYMLHITVSKDSGEIKEWKIGIDTPEQRLKVSKMDGEPEYLNLGFAMVEIERRLVETGVSFEKQEYMTKARTSWETDDFTLWFGTFENYPEDLEHSSDPNETFDFYQYTVKTPDYPTAKGIRVGDSVEKLLEICGPAQEIKEENGGSEYLYILVRGFKKDYNTNQVFTVESGKIISWYVTIADQVLKYDISN